MLNYAHRRLLKLVCIGGSHSVEGSTELTERLILQGAWHVPRMLGLAGRVLLNGPSVWGSVREGMIGWRGTVQNAAVVEPDRHLPHLAMQLDLFELRA
jgi:hypothetical protein